MGHLDGLKRAIDDEEYAKKLDGKYSKITDAALLAENYGKACGSGTET